MANPENLEVIDEIGYPSEAILSMFNYPIFEVEQRLTRNLFKFWILDHQIITVTGSNGWGHHYLRVQGTLDNYDVLVAEYGELDLAHYFELSFDLLGSESNGSLRYWLAEEEDILTNNEFDLLFEYPDWLPNTSFKFGEGSSGLRTMVWSGQI